MSRNEGLRQYDHVVVGGGVFGCFLALSLRRIDPSATVVIIERERALLSTASFNNQARIHNGYHYPRSLLTGVRSRVTFPLFVAEFAECVEDRFDMVYAVATSRSNVTAGQFRQFCQRIGAEVSPAPARWRRLFDEDMIEELFSVTEYAFDASILRRLLRERLAAEAVHVALGTEALVVRPNDADTEVQRGGALAVIVKDADAEERRPIGCNHLYNCTYSRLNGLLARSDLTRLHLRHEATEIALVTVPEELRALGITVVCGPFFSVMPFPARGLHSFSHVSYTPHYQWTEDPDLPYDPHRPKFPLPSNFERMSRDAARFMPLLAECGYVESLWEVKTVLPQSDANDSRPILVKRDPAMPRVVSILGGKVDNIFDLNEVLPHGSDEMPSANGFRVDV